MKGVEVRKLDVHVDERGWLAEILRTEHVDSNKKFGQFYVTTAHPGVVKANHVHKRKSEWFCVIKGRAKLYLRDMESGEKQEIELGEGNMVSVKIPPNVAHGVRNIGRDMMYLLAYIDEAYNPGDPDAEVVKVV